MSIAGGFVSPLRFCVRGFRGLSARCLRDLKPLPMQVISSVSNTQLVLGRHKLEPPRISVIAVPRIIEMITFLIQFLTVRH